MKQIQLKLLKPPKFGADLLKIGETYTIVERYPKCYIMKIDDIEISVNPEDFESPVDILTDMVNSGGKIILSKPTTGVTVDLLLTNTYLIVYSHTKGSHWNLGGNHYKYYHNLVSMNHEPTHPNGLSQPVGEVVIKQRLLMKDYNMLTKLYMEKNPK